MHRFTRAMQQAKERVSHALKNDRLNRKRQQEWFKLQQQAFQGKSEEAKKAFKQMQKDYKWSFFQGKNFNQSS